MMFVCVMVCWCEVVFIFGSRLEVIFGSRLDVMNLVVLMLKFFRVRVSRVRWVCVGERVMEVV